MFLGVTAFASSKLWHILNFIERLLLNVAGESFYVSPTSISSGLVSRSCPLYQMNPHICAAYSTQCHHVILLGCMSLVSSQLKLVSFLIVFTLVPTLPELTLTLADARATKVALLHAFKKAAITQEQLKL